MSLPLVLARCLASPAAQRGQVEVVDPDRYSELPAESPQWDLPEAKMAPNRLKQKKTYGNSCNQTVTNLLT